MINDTEFRICFKKRNLKATYLILYVYICKRFKKDIYYIEYTV